VGRAETARAIGLRPLDDLADAAAEQLQHRVMEHDSRFAGVLMEIKNAAPCTHRHGA
jgi:hypothetical protein